MKATEDVFKSEARFARRAHTTAHATNASNSLANIRCWPPLLRGTDKVELRRHIGSGLGGTHECMRVRLLMLLLLLKKVLLLLLLLLLVLFSTSRDLSILFRKHADRAGSDFVVDDRLVVFTHDVDAEFLPKAVRELF